MCYLILGGPAWSQELDSVILMGPFQLGIFCSPMMLWVIGRMFNTVKSGRTHYFGNQVLSPDVSFLFVLVQHYYCWGLLQPLPLGSLPSAPSDVTIASNSKINEKMWFCWLTRRFARDLDHERIMWATDSSGELERFCFSYGKTDESQD